MEEKKIPRIGLSLFSNFTESFSNHTKNPPLRTFGNSVEGGGGGGVGLGILLVPSSVSSSSCGNNSHGKRTGPLPIVSIVKDPPASFNKTNVGGGGDDDGGEDYTCVMFHFERDIDRKENLCGGGGQGVDRHEIFDGCASSLTVVGGRRSRVVSGCGSEDRRREMLLGKDFLSSCLLCRKLLHGLDIFMYRGEKAFCSVECREKHIVREDYGENCGSEARRTHEYSASSCSSPQLLFAGVAAA